MRGYRKLLGLVISETCLMVTEMTGNGSMELALGIGGLYLTYVGGNVGEYWTSAKGLLKKGASAKASADAQIEDEPAAADDLTDLPPSGRPTRPVRALGPEPDDDLETLKMRNKMLEAQLKRRQ